MWVLLIISYNGYSCVRFVFLFVSFALVVCLICLWMCWCSAYCFIAFLVYLFALHSLRGCVSAGQRFGLGVLGCVVMRNCTSCSGSFSRNIKRKSIGVG